jgi:hypothetical protein
MRRLLVDLPQRHRRYVPNTSADAAAESGTDAHDNDNSVTDAGADASTKPGPDASAVSGTNSTAESSADAST